jgi:hypothetical protein
VTAFAQRLRVVVQSRIAEKALQGNEKAKQKALWAAHKTAPENIELEKNCKG